MIPKPERDRIIALIHREVVPAMGCTEPIAVALCVAKATEVLGTLPDKIDVKLSANILKNAMGVGIPGTDMIGLPIAVALGAISGHSEYELEVIKDATPDDVERGRKYIEECRVDISLKDNIEEKLYIEVTVVNSRDSAVCVISTTHTNFVYIKRNDEVLLNKESVSADEVDDESVTLNMAKVYDFATTTPVDELRFILDSRRLNKAAAEKSLNGEYGHCVGKTLLRERDSKMMGNSMFARILAYTSAACDARMAGAMIPVMSNSGSGNQGIAATLPVVVYAEEIAASEEQTIRALVLSHLTVIYIKQSLGRLSALCGCVVAATGSSCGVTYLMGGGYDEVAAAVKNMIANLTGMICDGAKPSCAMKLMSGISTAILSAMMAIDHRCVSSVEGIIDDDVDKSIHNLTTIGRDGMNETDRIVLHIMTHKCS